MNIISKRNSRRSSSSNKNARIARAQFESLEMRALLTGSAAVWTGSNGDRQWNTAGNWQGNAVPTSGQDVVFPELNTYTAVNVTSAVTVGDLTLNGSQYGFASSGSITLNGNVTANADQLTVNIPLILTHTTTVTVAANDTISFDDFDDGGHTYGIIKQGLGKISFGSVEHFNGNVDVQQGDASEDGDVTALTIVDSGATLDGDWGHFGGVTANGGTVALSTDGYASNLYSTGNVSIGSGSTLEESYGGYAGSLIASGTSVNISGATLKMTLLNTGAAPTVGTVLPVISNLTGHAVTGKFSGLPEGAMKKFGTLWYQITYAGGSSHQDVNLTVVDAPSAPTITSAATGRSTFSTHPQLNILGHEDSTGDDSNLTYTWSVAHAPSGAKPVTFNDNGNSNAKTASPQFHKAGTYRLRCVVNSTTGLTTSKLVTITIRQKESGLRLFPHAHVFHVGDTIQYTGYIYDQFGRPIHKSWPITYDIVSGPGTIDTDGMFAATAVGHANVDITIGDMSGILGATIV